MNDGQVFQPKFMHIWYENLRYLKEKLACTINKKEREEIEKQIAELEEAIRIRSVYD